MSKEVLLLHSVLHNYACCNIILLLFSTTKLFGKVNIGGRSTIAKENVRSRTIKADFFFKNVMQKKN